jgi:hypothetical protein
VGITDPAEVIASEGDGAELSLSEQHSGIYYHGYNQDAMPMPSPEPSAAPADQVRAAAAQRPPRPGALRQRPGPATAAPPD